MIAWRSRETWLRAVADDITTPDGDAQRQRVKISLAAYLAVATADAADADGRTGRGLATSNATAAAHASLYHRRRVSERVAERARALMAARGYAVTIVRGRRMTLAETQEARATHGGMQILAASLRALTIPQAAARSTCSGDQPSLAKQGGLTHVFSLLTNAQAVHKSRPQSTTRPRKPKSEAAPRPLIRDQAKFGPEKPRTLAAQQLAARLIEVFPFLRDVHHVGQICDVLDRFEISPEEWTAGGLRDAINQALRRYSIHPPRRVHSPTGFLTYLLTLTLPDRPEPNLVRSRRLKAAAQAEIARDRELAQRQTAAKAKLKNWDPVSAAIIAEMKAQYGIHRSPRRR